MNTPNLHALCIGIGAYQHLNPLSCPAADATDVADLLTSGLIPTHIDLLTDSMATKPAVLSHLLKLAQRASADDTALVYLSGHGGRLSQRPTAKAYFCTVEARKQALAQTCISGEELTAALHSIQAGRLIVLIDSCYSGGMGEPRQGVSSHMNPLNTKDIAILVAGRGRAILAASRPDQVAWELYGMRNGLFTHYLLQGLKQEVVREDGTVWVSELFGYVSRELRRHKIQTPYQKAVGEDFVVAVHPAVRA